MNISIVIPCHNEEKNIPEITERFMKIIKETDLELYKIIFVDDGSTDHSWTRSVEDQARGRAEFQRLVSRVPRCRSGLTDHV